MDTLQYNDRGARYFLHGVPISEAARQRYATDDLEALTEDDVAPVFRFARLLALRMNEKRELPQVAARPAQTGELLAMILLHEIFRHLVRFYCRNVSPTAIDGALAYAGKTRGKNIVDTTLPAYVRHYPPPHARKDSSLLTSHSSFRDMTFIEILIVQLAHENPALLPYRALFDNSDLRAVAPYDALMAGLEEWFDAQPAFPDTGMTLLRLLREPIRNNPDSLEGQLEFIMRRWRTWLPPELIERLLITQGALREETMMRQLGPGAVEVLAFSTQDYEEPEAFSQDEDWMPRVVLIAKLAYVWLDQLSAKYGRPLTRLNDIPDEELDRLAAWGFNALWLIGVWERSPASREIKQRMGNPEAASSAYSLYDYIIAADLGGEEAYQNLAHRARLRGIRLAGDMVPNHLGLYSRWVVEHPDWFLQLREPPFPRYAFNGPDLSGDERVGLFIEDGYWNHSDAAVVFKRIDRHTGDVRYIYHGNDGTSMPWNDTAQLNFLSPEVREAIIGAIINVAHRFPIIRFDAAMTLAKRHYQRLWFPRPGEGGAIPSRAEHSMDKAAFDAAFPVEFWREVVDRIAVEAPDTLLLAEAFWLMEGYFVRTLGMHRVYNSAFMNMLKDEDNAKYRQTIKNVLEFSPAVLQRFVNFMNNPDEDTAQAQFGKGDKYFGVAAMLVTMPGLPMFGHGQVEGYTEKYGMEYRRAYYQETFDNWLIERHEREIFPLMRKRYLFSGAANFALFDFVTPDGWVDENVFAYTNRAGDERTLIIYNNAYNTTRGVLHTSTAINEGHADEQQLRRRILAEALALNTDDRYYSVLRDARSGLEYLRHNATVAEVGLHFELGAYEYKAFIAIRQVCDHDHTWGRLHALLGDRGAPDMEEAYIEMYLAEILDPFRALMTGEMVTHLLTTDDAGDPLGQWRPKLVAFLAAINNFTNQSRNITGIASDIETGLRQLRNFMRNAAPQCGYPTGNAAPQCVYPTVHPMPENVRGYMLSLLPAADATPDDKLIYWRTLAVYCLLRPVGKLALTETETGDGEAQSALWMRSWLLVKHIGRAFLDAGGDAWRAQQDARLAYVCMAHRARLLALDTDIWGPSLHALFEDADSRAFLQTNRFADRHWLNKEQLERLLHTLFLVNTFQLQQGSDKEHARLIACYENIQDILNAAADTGYDFDWIMEALK